MQKHQIIGRGINSLLCIINYQNVVIKHNTRVWTKYLQQKYQIVSRIINNIKKIIFFLCMYKWLILTKKHMKTMA